MKLPGLDALYWIAYITSRNDGDLLGRLYAVGFSSVLVMFPVAALMEILGLLTDLQPLLALSYVISIGIVALLVDTRRSAIVDSFAGFGLRFRDRIPWTMYTALFGIAIIGLSGSIPELCLIVFTCFVGLPVKWAIRRSS